MSEKKRFILRSDTAKRAALSAIYSAPIGYVVEIKQSNRSLEQNAKFHAICSDIAKSGMQWAGKPRTAAQWKVLLVSGHATATKEEVEIVPGLEGEFINIRESTANMTVKRGASLIEYALAFCANNGIEVNEVPAWVSAA